MNQLYLTGQYIAECIANGLSDYDITDATREMLEGTKGSTAAMWSEYEKSFHGGVFRTAVPAIVTGNFAPSGTTPTETASETQEIKQLLRSFMGRITELEEMIAGRPIRLESHVEINRRELGLAVAEYNNTNSNIINGNGGRW